jgi:Ca2+-binding EF-hand superfamily protein
MLVHTFDEFRNGLGVFGYFPNMDEALLFFTRYDTDKDQTLKYSEFCEIFCPRSKEYTHALNCRLSYYIHKPYYRPEDFFHPDTRVTIENLINSNLQVESIAETMRQHLIALPGFDILEAFNTCDLNNDGYVTK